MTTRPAERTSFDRLRLVGILIALSVSIGCGGLAVGLAESGNTDEARTLLNEILSTDDSFPARSDAEALLSKL